MFVFISSILISFIPIFHLRIMETVLFSENQNKIIIYVSNNNYLLRISNKILAENFNTTLDKKWFAEIIKEFTVNAGEDFYKLSLLNKTELKSVYSKISHHIVAHLSSNIY